MFLRGHLSLITWRVIRYLNIYSELRSSIQQTSRPVIGEAPSQVGEGTGLAKA